MMKLMSETNQSPDIISYNLAGLGGSFSFIDKLMQEEGWSRSFAEGAILEYKRFCYLAKISGHPVSPSETVDTVWHLHLLYTEEYWNNFCPNVMQRTFHHHPSLGGAAESRKHSLWYADTIASYERIFRELPPEKYWPPLNARFNKAGGVRNGSQKFRYMMSAILLFGIAILIFFSSAEASVLDPLLAIPGPRFLIGYILFLLVAFSLAVGLPHYLQEATRGEKAKTGGLSTAAIAYLNGGRKQMILACMAELEEAEAITGDDKLGLTARPNAGIAALSEPARALWHEIASKHVNGYLPKLSKAERAIGEDLIKRKLLFNKDQSLFVRIIPGALLIISLVIGIIRLFNGFYHSRPVGFLGVTLIIATFLAIEIYKHLPILTGAGKSFLDSQKRRNERLKIAARKGEGALAIALFGSASLTQCVLSRAYADSLRPSGYSGLSSGGCGSSCGGSSCSGGCGGGGCGGCGG